MHYLKIGQAREIILNSSPGFLILVLLVFLLDRFFMSWKWTVLLKSMALRISQISAFKIYYISSFLGVAIPFGVGPDVIRFFKAKKYELRGEAVMTSIIMERLLGLVSTIFMVLLGFSILLITVTGTTTKNELLLWLAIFAMILSGISILIFNDRVWTNIFGLEFVEKILLKLGCQEYYKTLSKFRKRKTTMVYFTFLSFMEQFFSILAVYFAGKALSIPIGLIGCLAFVPLTILAQRLPFTFMGLGLREGTYVLLLGLLNIDYTSAMLFSLLIFVMEILFLMPAGLWSLFDTTPPVTVGTNSNLH